MKISLPYFATSLSLSPAARFMAVGFRGEYQKVLWTLLPRLLCAQATFWRGGMSLSSCE